MTESYFLFLCAQKIFDFDYSYDELKNLFEYSLIKSELKGKILRLEKEDYNDFYFNKWCCYDSFYNHLLSFKPNINIDYLVEVYDCLCAYSFLNHIGLVSLLKDFYVKLGEVYE